MTRANQYTRKFFQHQERIESGQIWQNVDYLGDFKNNTGPILNRHSAQTLRHEDTSNSSALSAQLAMGGSKPRTTERRCDRTQMD